MQRWNRAARIASLLALALALGACLPVPVQRGPLISGTVIDAESGEPLAGALVVVRYDMRHDDLLPDRDPLGHVEVESDATGRFEAGPIWSPGVAFWPLSRVEVRVASVLRDDYRCAGPIAVPTSNTVEISLAASADAADRRISCRPVAALPSSVPRYVAAWRALQPEAASQAERVRDREVGRVLAARAELGYGVNCEGPAEDLSVAPGGQRVAFRFHENGADWVGILRASDGTPLERLPVEVPRQGRWQLGWTGPDELVFWEPTNDMDRTHSLALVSLAGGAPRVLWRAPSPGPASPAYDFEPSSSHDRASGLESGRSFELIQSLDPVSGLAREVLRVSQENGSRQDIGLPGEPCGQIGRSSSFGRRVADRGRMAFDLRYVGDACRVVAVDLWSGSWRIADDSRGAGVCRESRSVPASQLSTALGAYVDELQLALEAGDADPQASFSIRIGDDGSTSAAARGFDGEPRVLRVPDFPVSTPLRRIEVSVLGGGSPRASQAREQLSPL